MPEHFKTNEVFGVTNETIKTYVIRDKVDQLFVEGLTKNKHVVIYGASKQGKTSLTNKHLDPSQYIRVNCSSTSQPVDLYKSILRQLDIEFEESKESTTSTSGEFKVGLRAQVKIPLLTTAEMSGEGGGSVQTDDKRIYKSVTYNLDLAQDSLSY